MITWRPIVGFENLYEVSDSGMVRNARTELILKPRSDKDGYLLVTLWKGSPTKQYERKVHRLVLESFVGVSNGLETDHINRNKQDNSLGNLRWVTKSLNNRNTAARSQSGIKGVRFRIDRPNPWQAYVRHDGKFKSLGHFSDMMSAAAARLSFDLEHGYV